MAVKRQAQPAQWPFAYGRSQWPSDDHELIALKRIRRWLLKSGPCLSPMSLQRMDNGYAIADPLVDSLSEQRLDLIKVLAQPSLHPHGSILAEQMNHVLPDIDLHLVKIGAAAYRRYPLLQIWLLRNVSLMTGYSIPALSVPLLHTGALVSEALPRLYRTYEFIQMVSRDDALEIGGPAWQYCVKVRQMHAYVRHSLRKNWDFRYWGEPLNQSDMIATHLQFSLLIVLGYRWFGARLSAEEQQGIWMLWRQISTWLGVNPAAIPHGEQESLRWLYDYAATQKIDYSLGQPLAHALHELPTQIVGPDNRLAQWTEAVNASVTRLFVGDDVADGLDLPTYPARYGLLAIAPVLFGLELGADHVPAVRRSLNRLAAWRHTRVDEWMRDNVNKRASSLLLIKN